MQDTDISCHPFMAKRILITEAVLFLFGVLVITSEPIAGLYYYVVWFCLAAIINVIYIVLLLRKKSPHYVGYCIALLLLPLAAVGIVFAVMSNLTMNVPVRG